MSSLCMSFVQVVAVDILWSHLVHTPSRSGRNISVKVPILSSLPVEGVRVSGSDLKAGLSVGWLNQGNSQPCADGITRTID